MGLDEPQAGPAVRVYAAPILAGTAAATLHQRRRGFPEVLAERIWENLLKKLFQKDYAFDAGFYGSLNEYSRKVAYFFHASLQGTGAEPGAATALSLVADAGIKQGLLADGQCFTTVQLSRGLRIQDASLSFAAVLPPDLRILSCEFRARKPSETIFRRALAAMAGRGIQPEQILLVGSKIVAILHRPSALACELRCMLETSRRWRPRPNI